MSIAARAAKKATEIKLSADVELLHVASQWAHESSIVGLQFRKLISACELARKRYASLPTCLSLTHKK